jgi:hypothetical protein
LVTQNHQKLHPVNAVSTALFHWQCWTRHITYPVFSDAPEYLRKAVADRSSHWTLFLIHARQLQRRKMQSTFSSLYGVLRPGWRVSGSSEYTPLVSSAKTAQKVRLVYRFFLKTVQISTLFTFLFRVRNLGAIFEHALLASKSSTKILRTDFFSRLPAQLSLQSPNGDHRPHFEHRRCWHRNLLFPVHQVSDNRARVLDRQKTLYAIQTRNHKTFFRHVNSHLYVYFKFQLRLGWASLNILSTRCSNFQIHIFPERALHTSCINWRNTNTIDTVRT